MFTYLSVSDLECLQLFSGFTKTLIFVRFFITWIISWHCKGSRWKQTLENRSRGLYYMRFNFDCPTVKHRRLLIQKKHFIRNTSVETGSGLDPPLLISWQTVYTREWFRDRWPKKEKTNIKSHLLFLLL